MSMHEEEMSLTAGRDSGGQRMIKVACGRKKLHGIEL